MKMKMKMKNEKDEEECCGEQKKKRGAKLVLLCTQRDSPPNVYFR